MKIIALHNQTLHDIAIRHCGSIDAVIDIAVLNNVSITDDLVPGHLLNLPTKDYAAQEVINFFELNQMEPATALTEEQKALTEGKSGIGFWEIGNNFIVQ